MAYNELDDELEQHLQSVEQPRTVDYGSLGGEALITADKPVSKIPMDSEASLNDVIEQSPDDTQLENQYANEDFVANEEAGQDLLSEDTTGDVEEGDLSEADMLAESAPKEKMDESSFQRLLATLKPQPGNAPQQAAPNALEIAQGERDRDTHLNNLQRYSALIGSSVAKNDPNIMQKFLDRLEKQKDSVTKLAEKEAFKDKDPNSEVSTIMRDYLSKKGLKVSDQASAADLLKVAPYLSKDEALKNALMKTLVTQKGQMDRFQEGEKKKDERQAKALGQNEKQHQERLKNQLENRERLKDQTQFKNIETAQNQFNKDKIFVQAREALNSVDNAKGLLALKNPIADQAVLRQLARLSGEVGVLTDQDVKAFGGSKAITSRISQFLESAQTGKWTEENRNYMKKLVKVFEERRNDQIKNRASELAKQGAIRFGMQPKEVFDYLLPGEKMPSMSSDGKVVVSKDGKQFRLPKEQLKDAEKQGYTLVK